MGKTEEPGNHIVVSAQHNVAGDSPFGQSIQQQHDDGDYEEILTHERTLRRLDYPTEAPAISLDAYSAAERSSENYLAAAVSSISRNTALQRSHTVGYVWSSPTWIE